MMALIRSLVIPTIWGNYARWMFKFYSGYLVGFIVGTIVGTQWRTGTRETEVGLDGWCEGGLMQQRNNCGGCVTRRGRSERVESPGTYLTE